MNACRRTSGNIWLDMPSLLPRLPSFPSIEDPRLSPFWLMALINPLPLTLTTHTRSASTHCGKDPSGKKGGHVAAAQTAGRPRLRRLVHYFPVDDVTARRRAYTVESAQT